MNYNSLEYSEYKDIIDITQKKPAENAYQDLMKKEDKVLDSVTNVVKYYNDNEIKNKQFINMSFYSIANRFATVMIDITNDFYKSKNIVNDFFLIINKDDRIFYVGILFIIISILFFIIDII